MVQFCLFGPSTTGSSITEKPSEYVLTMVTKLVNLIRGPKSEISANSRVFDKDANLSAQNLRKKVDAELIRLYVCEFS